MSATAAGIAQLGLAPPALPVFAVKNKKPMAKGWKDSLPASLDEVAGWEPTCTGCGWAAAVVNDLFIVDCDGEAALGALCDDLDDKRPIPPTLMTLTPRGFHLWFNKPKHVAVGNRVAVKPGVDVRAAGGYVVIPPSDGYAFTDLSAPIADAPEWLLELVTAKPQDEPDHSANYAPRSSPEPTPVSVSVDALSPYEHDMATRGWERRKPRQGKVTGGRSPKSLRIALEPGSVTTGKRNDLLFSHLGLLRRKGYTEESLRTEAHRLNSRITEPLSAFEVDKTVDSVVKYESKAGV